MSENPNREVTAWRCYCGRNYATSASLRRHRPDCVLSAEPYRDFLCLLACLGGLIPGSVLYRASAPAFCWNERGAPTRDDSCDLPGFLKDLNTLNEIIRAVQALGVVQLEPDSGSGLPESGSPRWASYQFRMMSNHEDFILKDLQPWTVDGETLLDIWKRVALRLLVHAFPVENIDADFYTRGPAYTPLLLRLLKDEFVTEKYVHSKECHRLALICATASKFAGKDDQEFMLSTAEHFTTQDDQTPPSLAYQIQLLLQRKTQVFGGKLSIPPPPRPATNLGNALEAEGLLLTAKQDIEDGNMSKIWSYLHWKPVNVAQPSKLEAIAVAKMSLLSAKLHRLSGDFSSSRRLLHLLVEQHPPLPCQYLLRAKTHLAAVCGELGIWNEGKQVLQSMHNGSTSPNHLIRLSEAEFDLSRSLATSEQYQGDKDAFRNLFDSAVQESLEVNPKSSRRNVLRCCIGLAIIAHLQSRSGNHISLVNAISNWQTAKAACRLVPEQSFAEMVCCIATAEILLRIPDPSATAELAKAVEIRDRLDASGRQYRFVLATLGTRWADLVNDWIEAHGRARVLRRWQDCVTLATEISTSSQ